MKVRVSLMPHPSVMETHKFDNCPVGKRLRRQHRLAGRPNGAPSVWEIELSRNELKCKCLICIGQNRKDPLCALNTHVHIGGDGKHIWQLPA